jgi:hypothetical protein
MGADPISLGVGSLVLQAIGTGAKAFGEYSAGQDAARVAEQNAQLAERAAGDALSRGEEQAARIRGETDRLIGSQRAAYGAAGVELGYGSPLDVMVGSRRVSEQDIATTRLNAARESWGYRAQAQQFRQGGQAAAQAGALSALGTGIAGGTQTLLGTNDLLQRLGVNKKKDG